VSCGRTVKNEYDDTCCTGSGGGAGWCGDGDCRSWEGEYCDDCIDDCGVCSSPPPGGACTVSNFSADLYTVDNGTSTMLHWNASNSIACWLHRADPADSNDPLIDGDTDWGMAPGTPGFLVGPNGSKSTDSLTSDKKFILNCWNNWSLITCPLRSLTINVNATPTCGNGIKDPGEIGIDCGGPCPPCDCTPSTTDSRGCGNRCGTETKTCDDYGKWGSYGACLSAASNCVLGTTDSTGCNGGVKTCQNDCTWSACSDPGHWTETTP